MTSSTLIKSDKDVRVFINANSLIIVLKYLNDPLSKIIETQ